MLISNRDTVLTDIVEVNGNYYYVDSRYTFDHGYETMVFPCDSNGKVTNWRDLYANWYDTNTEMEIGHAETIANLANILA